MAIRGSARSMDTRIADRPAAGTADRGGRHAADPCYAIIPDAYEPGAVDPTSAQDGHRCDFESL
jgi:hypothetical protein